MDSIVGRYEHANRKKGALISTTIHVVILIIFLAKILDFPIPPPGQPGIMVNLGFPDQGQGEENAPPTTSEEESSEPEEVQPEEVAPEPEPEPTPEPPKPVKESPKVVKEKEVVKTEDPNEVALRKQKEKEAREKAEQERQAEEAARKKAAEEAAKRKAAEAEAKRKADEEAKKKAEADALKNEIGGLFGSGSGKGNTGKPGNQGDPNGDPNSSVLTGISTGSGTVGGGLGNRGVLGNPRITDDFDEKGKVVIEVCVDGAGSVVSATFTQKGSTTTSSRLQAIAIANAKKWKFSKSSIDKQCGTITYDFKLK